MVRFIRSGESKLGVFPQSLAFAKRITKYCKKTYKIDIKTYANSAGVLFWIVDYKDYADYEQTLKKINSDKKYWQIVATTKNLFIEGTLCDEIITPVD